MRIATFSRWLEDASAQRTEPWRFGTALFDDAFPNKWDANFLRVERPVGEATASELAAEADRRCAHLEHREFIFADDAEGARLAAAFVDIGYTSDRLVNMVLHREADRSGPPGGEEATFEDVSGLLMTITAQGFPNLSTPQAQMLVDHDRALAERVGARFFWSRVDGVPAGCCQLFEHDGVAQVENVSTLEEFRNRGLARSFVGAAIDAAHAGGADLVFLVADDADWPKHLYGKLGFDEVSHFRQFTRPPAGSTVH